jgi:hypothetical protein
MSGLRPIEFNYFYRSLRARRLTTELLAAQICIGGPTLRKMIVLLKPRRGRAWQAFLALLTEHERGLLATVEQCATWNNRQRRKRPVWTAKKVAELAETYGHENLANERDRLRQQEAIA